MASWSYFLFVYLLGGLTFLPLAIVVLFIHAYFTFPYRDDVSPAKPAEPAPDDIVQPGDDLDTIQAARKLLKDEEKPRVTPQEPDVAAGYFAVCREYTPMGINAKPIERSTPVGAATVAAPSQSVYQSMYRSLFDRKQAPSPLDHSNNASQRPKKAGNVFYVVLRHGHLMLFDDDEQLEVRHVISLAHHDISIYSGGDKTPEGELWIKRNAIALCRRSDRAEVTTDGQSSKPFYLFSENCSAKEDFYFALLRNQEQTFTNDQEVPKPVQFEVKNIIALVQKLHSSEEHLQTRWLNAMIGRIFLGTYKTPDLEAFIRAKLTKKIARVKRPSFLSNITIQNIDTGDSAPYFTNPRLKDLTVEGECCIETDVKYTGNFRIEVATTARIDLGSRFKAREVNLVLAVVVRKLEGHAYFKIKPPPSNRIWFSFQHMPKMEMTVEPIISSRQITYTVILRQIENRIKEVMAETLVQPFWDDIPFFETSHKKWRGGIWAGDNAVAKAPDVENSAAQSGDVDDVDRYEEAGMPSPDLPLVEKSHSIPTIETGGSHGLFGRKINGKLSPVAKAASSSLSLGDINPISLGRQGRSASFAKTSVPISATDSTNADAGKLSSTPPNESPAMSAMSNLSGIVQPQPSVTDGSTATRPAVESQESSHSSTSSKEALEGHDDDNQQTPKSQQPRRNTQSSTGSSIPEDQQPPSSPATSTKSSTTTRNRTGSTARGFFLRRDPSQASVQSASSSPTTTSTNNNHHHFPHRQQQQPQQHDGSEPSSPKRSSTLAASMTNAAATAKRWGMGGISAALLQRRNNHGGGAGADGAGSPHGGIVGGGGGNDHEVQDEHGQLKLDLSKPMGGGRPLPPPGTPLPMPDKRKGKVKVQPPRRKAVPPPGASASASASSLHSGSSGEQHRIERRPVPAPQLPKRRAAAAQRSGDGGESGEGILVVEAPLDSEPTTPVEEEGGMRWGREHEDEHEEEVVEGEHEGVSPALGPGRDDGAGEGGSSGEQTPLERTGDDAAGGGKPEEEDDDYSAWMEQDDGEVSVPAPLSSAAGEGEAEGVKAP